MTLPTNDEFATRELSLEELEMIAAGGFWSSFKHDLAAGVYYTLKTAAYVAGGTAIALGVLVGVDAVATAGMNIANRFQQN